VLFVGEAPGYDENRKGIVFVGKTGEEVNRHYLPLAGLRREDVTFVNAIACYPNTPKGKLDPKKKAHLDLLSTCAQHRLYPLIERMRPKVIVAMGTFANLALRDEVDLDLEHGMPQDSHWGIPLFPMWHPAQGLHEPKKMLLIRNDWMRLKSYLRGTLVLPTDPYPEPDYAEVCTPDEISRLDSQGVLGLDTEITRTRDPFCLTYSVAPGWGRLIRADRFDLLRAFSQKLTTWRGPILAHNLLFDYHVCTQMGLHLPHDRLVDTMALVYHLGNLPQGLKALCRRELGMVMQDFEDVVRPHSAPKVLAYYMAMRDTPYEWTRPPQTLERQKDGTLKLKTPQKLETKIKRFFTDWMKSKDKDIFAHWDNWDAHHEEVEAILGPWPGLDICHVPFEHTLHYACRDADALLRLYPLLTHMARRVRKGPQEKWRLTA
jgi:uracil-DNA glycosylase family 4